VFPIPFGTAGSRVLAHPSPITRPEQQKHKKETYNLC
jgi:hypothetical protein